MRKLVLFTFLLTACFVARSQDFSNKGKDFWIGYGNHVRMFTGNPVEKMQIYITSDVNTTGTVEIASIGFTVNFVITANQITTIDIPRSAALMNEGLYNHGIHVTALKPVVVYSFIYVNSVSGATLCLPTTTLGREYYSVNYTQVSNEPNASYSYFFAVATDTGTTTIQIKPTQLTAGGRPANVPFTVNLTQGQVYQVLAQQDLSGSEIVSVNNGSGCKKIAVFCGAGKMSIGCANAGSSDNLYQQMYPTSTWGKVYLTAPSINTVNINGQYNYFRIFKSDPAAIVKFNGGIIPAGAFVNGQFATLAATNEPGIIESDMPIMVAQYFTTQGCSGNGGVGDPEMLYLNPVEQTINRVTLNSMQPTTGTNINQHFVNIILKNDPAAINSFRIDGVGYPGSFTPHPYAAGYSYARIQVGAGAHTVTCDTPFNAIAYGFGQTESYGYSAGTNLKDLYQFVSIQNDYATVTFPAGCKATPFKFSMTFPYQPTSITWKFNGLFADTTISTPVPDSTWVVNGRTLYRYKLNKTYQINATGTYPISVLANNPTVDGCTGLQEIEYDLQIFDPPIADFTFTHNGCVSDSVSFLDATNGLGRAIIKYYWDFGDATTGTTANPKHKYLTAGNKIVRHSAITDVGCLSDTAQKIIPITDPPVAAFTTQAPYCEKSPITFTNASTITTGTITRWSWNFGDASTLNANNGNPVQHTYASPGTYIVTLQVETNTGCLSNIFTQTIVIRPKPVVDFTLPNVCLPVGAAQFTDLSTISDGSQAGFTYAWEFGDGGLSTQKNPLHNYGALGPFTVKLTVTSNNGCVDDSVKTLTTVYAQPDAVFNAPTAVCVSDSASFTDQSVAANSSVTQWNWDFGDGTTSTLQNPKKKWATAGTYTVKLYVFSAIGCLSDTATTVITVHALPTAAFAYDAVRCETKSVSFTDNSVPNSGVLNKWTWTFGDGGTATLQNPAHIYATAGTYPVTLVVESDKGCVSVLSSQSIVVNAQPRAAFTMPVVCLPVGTGQFLDQSTISDGTQAQFTYNWDFGDGGSATLKDPVHRYLSTGPFNVKLTVTSNNGCVDDSVRVMNTVYPQPRAAFTVSPEVCLNDTTRFTDASDGKGSAISQWNWTFGDGGVSTTQNPTRRYLNANTYIATLFIVTDKGCVSDTMSLPTVVNPLPTAAFSFSAPTCEVSEVTFTDLSQPNAGVLTKWDWNFGDGNLAMNQNPVNTYAAAGTYNVTLSVETNKGCKSPLLTRPVRINYLPRPNFGTPEVCLTDPFAEFTDSSSIGDNSENQFTYLWNFGDPNANAGNPNTSTQKNPRHRYIATGLYNVTLTVTSKDGCVKSVTKPFTVNGSVPVAGYTVNNAAALCANQDVTINDASTVDFGSVVKVEIYWDYNNNPTVKTVDDNPAPGKLYTHKYPDFGSPATRTYNVRYVAYSGINCINEISKTVTVKASPAIQFDAMNNVCEEITPFQVTAARETFGFAGTGTFSGPGVSASGIFNPAAAKPGVHTLRYSFVAANGCSTFAEQTIKVDPTPTVDAGPDRTVLEGGFIQLQGRGTGNNISYLWTPNTAIDNAAVVNPKVSPVDDITYTLTVVSADGCRASDNVFVKVLKAPRVPNAFSPNGDGINDKWVIEYLESYPGATVEVFNRYGQLVYRSEGYDKPWDGTLNGNPLPVATYYWIINPKNGRKQMNGSVTIIR